ncbi:hypothetical protein JCM5353_001477, partial [Sporobolomyces roseus]
PTSSSTTHASSRIRRNFTPSSSSSSKSLIFQFSPSSAYNLNDLPYRLASLPSPS